MSKIKMEDIKFNNKKKIVPVDLPKSSKIVNKIEIEKEYSSGENLDHNKKNLYNYFNNAKISKRLFSTPQSKIKSKIFHKSTLVFLVIALIFGILFWSSKTFEKADVFIKAKKQTFTFENKQFLSSKDLKSSIDFEIMIFSDSEVEKLTLSESQSVSVKAKGSIVLFNKFTSSPQKIFAGTFLADSYGKSYKTDKTIIIPGYKINGKEIIPGQVEVNITAFLPGDSYNGEPTDFNISSFKNTDKFNKIYGKLKTPLTGGTQGLVYSMTLLDKDNIDIIANNSFKNRMLTKAKAEVPSGYILYPNAINFSYIYDDKALFQKSNAEIELFGNLSVILLKENDLSDSIIRTHIPKISITELRQINLLDKEKLIFNFSDENQIINKETKSFSFKLSGVVNAVWSPYVEKLKIKLAQAKKDNVQSILNEDKGIDSALVRVFPPWKKYLPTDIEKIKINIQ